MTTVYSYSYDSEIAMSAELGDGIDSAPLLSQLSDTTRRGSLLLPKQRRGRIMMEHGRLLFKARDRAVL